MLTVLVIYLSIGLGYSLHEFASPISRDVMAEYWSEKSFMTPLTVILFMLLLWPVAAIVELRTTFGDE